MLDTAVQAIKDVVQSLFDVAVNPVVEVPEEQFGDAATNVAMRLAKDQTNSPLNIAQIIADELAKNDAFSDVSVAGPGFINIKFTDASLLESLNAKRESLFANQKVVTEYSDPNPFKVLHAGHLYTSIIGDVISNLYELHGADVSRVNFGGDVGRHVARAMWGIINELGSEDPAGLASVPEGERSDWLSKCYVEGTAADESGDHADEVLDLNKRIYDVINNDDRASNFPQIYWTCRQWSYDYFDAFYERLGTPFEKYYPESTTAPIGLETVQRELDNGVYEESDGAIIFDGEKHGLHKRVFVNSEGLPTYEAKDIGLAMLKWQDYSFDANIIITGDDIREYMKVILASLAQFQSEIAERTTHVTHGMVKLKGGVKMSSRLGNFLRAIDIIDATKEATDNADDSIVLAAVKYSFLRQSIGGDVIFDIDESVTTHGNSGPYLQYAHARARSILAKANSTGQASDNLEAGERVLARKLALYNPALKKATLELAPHVVCTYLYDLAQTFNKFYEDNMVIGNEREDARLHLVSQYAETLREGLGVLGIQAPDHI